MIIQVSVPFISNTLSLEPRVVIMNRPTFRRQSRRKFSGLLLSDFLRNGYRHSQTIGEDPIHIKECIDAITHVVDHANKDLNTYNLGTRTTTSVTAIADIVSEELDLDPEYSYTGGDHGWTGDVPKTWLSIEKLSSRGEKLSMSSHEAVRQNAQELIGELIPERASNADS
jgi:nucleoside-diphosphate-sugar epimerase